MLHDRTKLLVAGDHGHLAGFVLLAEQHLWFSDRARMTVVSVFMDPDHRNSAAAHRLVRFANLTRLERDKELELIAITT